MANDRRFPARPKRRWFQFSLRTLFVLMTVFAIWLGVQANRARQQERAVAAIQALGGQVTYVHQITGGVMVGKKNDGSLWAVGVGYDRSLRFPAPQWLQRAVGEHYFVSVGGVSLSTPDASDAILRHIRYLPRLRFLSLPNTQVSDQGLAHLEGLTLLETLNLDCTQITDEGLKHLKDLKSLQLLSLNGTAVSDAGLRHLEGLKKLRVLFLGINHPDGRIDGTKITDAGLEHLKTLTSLEVLSVGGTEVTESGEEELQKALPNLTITH